MRGAWAIAKREVRSYFHAPAAYVAIAGFLLIRALFFSAQLIQLEVLRLDSSTPSPYLTDVVRALFAGDLFWAFMLVVPLVTMKQLAEERSQQTAPLLLTAPLAAVQTVVGKFLGAMSVIVIMVLLSLNMPGVIVWYGETSVLPLASGLVSAILLGAFLVAVGLLASALSESQFVAAFLGVGFNLVLYSLGTLVTRIGFIGKDLDQFSVLNNLDQLGRGVVDTAPLVFFITGTGFFLFLTTRVVESQRWR